MTIALGPHLDDGAITDEIAATGRARIDGFLQSADAARLATAAETASEWLHVLNSKDKVFEMRDADHRALDEGQARALEALTYRSAAEHFQYRYDTIRLADRRPDATIEQPVLSGFVELMNSAETLHRLRRWTGVPDIAFADGQATRYRPGDFLTSHDDDVDGKNRRFAYVLSLSDHWRADWGGLLLFQKRDGTLQEAWAPRFNTLALFRVGQSHAVSMVAPFAPRPRYSLTGWLRAE